MSRFFIRNRKKEKKWKQHLPVHLTGLTLCLTILVITTYEKFREGGWITLLITSMVIGLCYLIKGHYSKVREELGNLDGMLLNLPTRQALNEDTVNPSHLTAIILVNGYNGFGVHTVLSVIRNYRNFYRNFVFISVGIVDSGSFKGAEEVGALKTSVKESLEKYVRLARSLGFPAEYRMEMGTEVVETAAKLCQSMAKTFPQSMFFMGQLTFRLEKSYHRLLHNETAFALQRHLHWHGIPAVILPIRVEV
jgi:K+ transporter